MEAICRQVRKTYGTTCSRETCTVPCHAATTVAAKTPAARMAAARRPVMGLWSAGQLIARDGVR